MIEAMIVGGDDSSDLPRVFREMPLFIGEIGQLPVELRNPHVLHITILKSEPIAPFAHMVTDLAKMLRGPVDAVSALGGEDFYSGWCLTYGTAKMFEDAGTILLDEEKTERVDVPAIVGDSWGLRAKRLGRGARPYSDLEIAVQQNLGAQFYRVERLLVGALRKNHGGNPAIEAQSVLEAYLKRFKTSARGATQRSKEADYAFRRLREDLGPKRLLVLHGAASVRAIGARLEEEGSGFRVPARREEGWALDVPELAIELALLEPLLVICQRVNRLQNFIDRTLDLTGLDRQDDPVLLMPERSAEELLGFGSDTTGDRMPNLVALTRIAFDFDCNGAAFYPSLGPLTLHLAAACALGRRSRGATVKKTALERWGLRGLADDRFDSVCFPELREARRQLRSLGRPGKRSGGKPPPFLPPRDGFYNVPIVLKTGRG